MSVPISGIIESATVSKEPDEPQRLVQTEGNAQASREMSKQSFVLMIGRGLCFLINLATPLFLVRYFTQSEYGEYRQIMLILSSFSVILPLGLINSLYYFLPSYPLEKRTYLSRTFLVLLFNGFVFTLVFALFNQQIAGLLKNDHVISYHLYLSLGAGMFALSTLIETVLIVDNQVRLSTKVLTITQVLRMLTIIGCGIWGGVTYIVYGLLGFFVVKVVGSLIYLRLKYHISVLSLHMKKSYEHFRYSLLLGLGGISVSLSEVVDKYMLSNMLGMEKFAVYAVGCYELPFVAIVFSSIADVALPRIVKLQQESATEEVASLWHYTIKSSMLIGIPMFVLFSVFADQFITTAFTEKYVAAVPIFRLALVPILLDATRYGMITRAYARMGFMFAVSFMSLLLVVPGCYFGIKYYGMMGAVTAVVASKFFIVSIEIVYSKFILSLSWKRLLPFGFMTKVGLLSIASAMLAYSFPLVLPVLNKWLTLFITFSAFIVLYAYFTNFFRFWTAASLPLPLNIKSLLNKLYFG